MHFHRIFLLPFILVYQITFSITSHVQMKFSQDDVETSLIKYITKEHYKLVGIKLRFENDTDTVIGEKRPDEDYETATTIEYLNLVALDDDEYETGNKDKEVLREIFGWKPVLLNTWDDTEPRMGKKEPLNPKYYVDGCPPGFHKDLRPESELIAEQEAKNRALELKDMLLSPEEKRKKKRRQKDMMLIYTTTLPRRCRVTLERGYVFEKYVDFNHQ